MRVEVAIGKQIARLREKRHMSLTELKIGRLAEQVACAATAGDPPLTGSG